MSLLCDFTLPRGTEKEYSAYYSLNDEAKQRLVREVCGGIFGFGKRFDQPRSDVHDNPRDHLHAKGDGKVGGILKMKR